MGITAVFAGISAVGAVMQYSAAQDAANAQAQQAQIAQQQLGIQQQSAQQQNIRAVRQQVRQARAARAAIVNSAAVGGVSTSSGAIGGAGAVGTQMAGELDYFGKMRSLQEQDFSLQQQFGAQSARIGQAQATSAMGGALGAIGMQGYTIFSPTKGGKA